MVFKEFLHYFRPHITRLIVAALLMVSVGVFTSGNLVAAKPMLEIIFGEVDFSIEQYKANLAKKDAEANQNALPIEKWWMEATEPYRALWREYELQYYTYAIANKHQTLLVLAIVLVVFTTIKSLSEYFSKYNLSYSLYAVSLRLQEDLFEHIMYQDAAFFNARTTGFLESRLNTDVKALRKVFDIVIRDAIQQPLIILSLGIFLFISNPKLTLMAIVVIPIAAIPIAYFSKKLRRLTRKSQKQTDNLFSFAEEALRNYRLVKVYDSVDFEVNRYRKKNQKLFGYFVKQRAANFAQSPIMEVLGVMGAAVILVYGGGKVVDGATTMRGSDFITYLAALTLFYTPIRKLTKINVFWQGGLVAAERIKEVFDFRSDVVDPPNGKPLERIERELTFQNVSFQYDEEPVLQNINITLPLGKVIAIVGKSGAGKSSLANLLPRLFDPSDGDYLIDGVSAREYRLGDLRRCFGVVTQETILFNDTVERNIAYGETQPIDPARVESAAHSAYAHDFIMDLEGGLGYQTVIGQAGARLSGGQRQRLAIARAIYRDPQVLIFDEATSALDEESQRFVQAAIDNLLKNRTAIVIAHRLSTIRNADCILVMDRGRIVESGRHDELINAGGLYCELYQHGQI